LRRKIIKINLDKCNGCGLCLPNCPEGALQLIDGKARLISDLYCDGLGACIGHCPEGAILAEEREAEPYDETKVMENVVRQGPGVILAHLQHLREHDEDKYLDQALAYLRARDVRVDFKRLDHPAEASGSRLGGCPGAQAVSFGASVQPTAGIGPQGSQLTHWPIQLHLINPLASHYRDSEVLLAADCVAYALGGFHDDYLRGKSLAIACPKLDDGQDEYLEKLQSMIEIAQIKSITVMMMQVPCCGGLLHLARRAVALASRKVPVRYSIVGVRGEILQEGVMPDAHAAIT
jgi:NAD-dependent dihydropyrimidine dehydrogenase PreA subunit